MRAEAQPVLRGRWLLLARLTWLAVTALSVGLFLASIPPYFSELQNVCTRGAWSCADNGLLTNTGMRELRALGLSMGFYAAYNTALGVVFELVWCAVGAIIFSRRSDDRMALLAATMLVTFSAVPFGFLETLASAYPAWTLPVRVLATVGFTSIILFFYTFADGRFVPRWMLFPALIWILNDTISTLFPKLDAPGLTTAGFLAFFIPAVCAMGSQVYRYRRASDPVQRQQTKWVVFGVVFGFGGYLALVVLGEVFLASTRFKPLPYMLFQTVTLALLLVIPLSIGFAVLRSRLWNIDVVINRTLVYGLLTASLGLVYFGSIVLLQYVFRAFTGGESQLAVVASTLAIAALFGPLRRRIQDFIDRRFYRRKYDATQVLATFGARLRNEVELDTLSEDLLAVVNETMQPEHVRLWLRPTGDDR